MTVTRLSVTLTKAHSLTARRKSHGLKRLRQVMSRLWRSVENPKTAFGMKSSPLYSFQGSDLFNWEMRYLHAAVNIERELARFLRGEVLKGIKARIDNGRNESYRGGK